MAILMPPVTRKSLTAPEIWLPPPFRLVTLREVGDAFAHATAHAAEDGAGTMVYVGRFDLAEFAVILEPDEPLRTARRAFYACMVALADALDAYAPPETPIAFDWPGSINVNLGLVGGGRLAWPKDADENNTPDWLVFGGMIRLVSMTEGGTGLRPFTAALEEEGFDDLAAAHLVEAFARHLMMSLDSWREEGFGAVAKRYLPRLVPEKEKGAVRQIEETGDLLIRMSGKAEPRHCRLVPALIQPAWFDPETGGPRA